MCPSGMRSSYVARTCGVYALRLSGVSMAPGASALTLMPLPPNSTASTCVRARTAPFAVQYAESSAIGCRWATDVTLTIRPPPEASMRAIAARQPYTYPMTFDPMSEAQSSSEVSRNGCTSIRAALLIQMSSPPNSSCASPATSSADAGSAASASTRRQRRPSASTAAAVSRARACSSASAPGRYVPTIVAARARECQSGRLADPLRGPGDDRDRHAGPVSGSNAIWQNVIVGRLHSVHRKKCGDGTRRGVQSPPRASITPPDRWK